MRMIFERNKEAVKAIMGWCALNSGSRVEGERPDGLGTSSEGGAWDEERWCFDRVEASILEYKRFFPKTPNIAAQELRKSLKAAFWDEKELSCLETVGIEMFKDLVGKECKQVPRLKEFEAA